MKKILFLFLFIPLFVSCGDSDDEDDTSSELKFISLTVTSDDATSPEGVTAIFYLGTDSVASCGVTNEIYFAKRKSDGETIFSVDDDDLLQEEGCSKHSFFLSQMSSLYGVPKEGNYAIFVKLKDGKYPKTWKLFYVDSNKKITVHIPSASDYSETVESTWTISDY